MECRSNESTAKEEIKGTTLVDRIEGILKKNNKPMTLSEIVKYIQDKPSSTVRGRIYENLGKKFKRISRGVYVATSNDVQAMVIEGNGRDLSMIKNESIDAIITDHPWDDAKSNIGGARKFSNEYECFKYCQEDFDEKVRVLKNGAFCVEILPAENANNYEYLYEIKKMAEKAGLLYYAKVPWKKGNFVSNTGRKAKNTEDIMFFSKGKARCLRPNAKKQDTTMSGSARMLPTAFDVPPVPRAERIHQAEKPVKLYEQIIDYVTLKNETVLDQFAGSGNLGKAALNMNRNAILFEIDHRNVSNIVKNLNAVMA